MAYATILRLLAALCYLSVIGIPFGLLFHYQARQKEKERKREMELLAKHADGGK